MHCDFSNSISNSQLAVILTISWLLDTISISQHYKNLSVASCTMSFIRIHHRLALQFRLRIALLLLARYMFSIQLLLYIMLQVIHLGLEECTKSEFVPHLAGEVDIHAMIVFMCSTIRHYQGFKASMWHGSDCCFRSNTGMSLIHVPSWIGFHPHTYIT